MLVCKGGLSEEERAYLIVRVPRKPGDASLADAEHWIVDYKTVRREKDREEADSSGTQKPARRWKRDTDDYATDLR
jgi:hypothetical protein